MDASTALAAGALGGILGIVLVAGIVIWVLLVIAHWRMFEKAGEKGWKSLIPIYSDYTLFKLVWSTKYFWIYVGLIVASAILGSMSQSYAILDDGSIVAMGTSNTFVDLLSMAAYFGILIVYAVVNSMTAIAYGKGMVYAFGLTILPNIFTLILAFGNATYRGPQN